MARLRTISDSAEIDPLLAELADLAAHGREGEVALTMYIDLEAHERENVADGTFWLEPALQDLFDSAPDDPAWHGTLEDTRALLESVDTTGARGLLLYATKPGDAPTIVMLPVPVRQHISWDQSVHLRPLVEAKPEGRWCVAMMNFRTTRILVGDAIGFSQLGAYIDDEDELATHVTRSRTRFRRSKAAMTHARIRETIRAVREMLNDGDFDYLLIATTPQLRAAVEAQLTPELETVFAGWADADIEHTSTAEVAELVAEQITKLETRHVFELLNELQQNASRGVRGALGIEEVLRTAREQRIATLLLADGYAHPGFGCPEGDWLSLSDGECPLHGTELEPVADVVDSIVDYTLRTGADVVNVPRIPGQERTAVNELDDDHPNYTRMRGLGSIGALLRFDLN